MNTTPKRGDIFWAELPEPVGAEPGYRRPVVIVSANSFNRSLIKTVLAVVVTTNLRLARAPGNLYLAASESGLQSDCVINVSQLLTLDKRFLTERVGPLPMNMEQSLAESLKLVLALDNPI